MAAPAPAISKQEYLQRYVSSEDVTTKKKTKKIRKGTLPMIKSDFRRSKVVDDDIDLRDIAAFRGQDELDLEFGEEAPQIAAFVDERPTEVVEMEAFERTNRWRRLGADNGDDDRDSSTREMPPPSDRDLSPPRTKGRLRHDSDSTSGGRSQKAQRSVSPKPASPPPSQRQSERSERRSPPSENYPKSRRRAKDFFEGGKGSDRSSTFLDSKGRGNSDLSPAKRDKNGSDSDQTPPRAANRRGKNSSSPSPVRRDRNDCDQSPPRKKNNFGFDQSPPRRRRRNSGSDQSPRRKKKSNSGSDQSPPRRRRRQNSDSDQSPPRKRGNNSDSDQSPPRRRNEEKSLLGRHANRNSSIRGDGRERTAYRSKENSRWFSPSVDGVGAPGGRGTTSKLSLPTKTLDGKLAGLQNATILKSENDAAKEREKRMFEQLGEDILGRNAKTIVRDRASGKQRDLEAESREKAKEEAVKAAREAKYKEWSKGLKQQEIQERRVAEVVHEMAKPLARYDDDADLERDLRQQERTGDPMLEYMRKKKAAERRAATGSDVVQELPKYRGPAPPPNRYHIAPGYRWDGLDRSNGFEKQRVARQANKMAVEEDAYKWSVENM